MIRAAETEREDIETNLNYLYIHSGEIRRLEILSSDARAVLGVQGRYLPDVVVGFLNELGRPLVLSETIIDESQLMGSMLFSLTNNLGVLKDKWKALANVSKHIRGLTWSLNLRVRTFTPANVIGSYIIWQDPASFAFYRIFYNKMKLTVYDILNSRNCKIVNFSSNQTDEIILPFKSTYLAEDLEFPMALDMDSLNIVLLNKLRGPKDTPIKSKLVIEGWIDLSIKSYVNNSNA